MRAGPIRTEKNYVRPIHQKCLCAFAYLQRGEREREQSGVYCGAGAGHKSPRETLNSGDKCDVLRDKVECIIKKSERRDAPEQINTGLCGLARSTARELRKRVREETSAAAWT
jgi:hypothetical protein